MSFQSLLDDRCDIYHLVDTVSSAGYGMPTEKKKGYNEIPSLTDIPCHFNKTSIINMKQGEPQNEYPFERKLNLPIGTAVHSMDKIVDKSTGITYYAGIPDVIRNHHIAVPLRKSEEYL